MDEATQKRVANEFYRSIRPTPDLSAVWHCPWDQIASYPITPASSVGDDLWIIPEEWCPVTERRRANRTVDFSRAIPGSISGEEAEGLKRRLKRLMILDRFQTLRIGRQNISPPATTTWAKRCRLLIGVARQSLQTHCPIQKASSCPDGMTLFASLTPADFENLKSSNPAWGSNNIRRLNALFSSGLFDDWPAPDVAPHRHAQKVGSKAHSPFTDDAFTQILRAAIWLSSIQADVLQAFLELKNIDCTQDGRQDRSEVFTYRRERVRSWMSPTLTLGAPFPFDVTTVGDHHKMIRYSSWPLDTVRGVKALLSRCQTANAILVLASTGMRSGELQNLKTNVLDRDPNADHISGQSFKASDLPYGETRDWPFPQAATNALKTQIALAEALGKNERLWVSFGGEKNTIGVPAMEAALREFGKAVALSGGVSLDALDGIITPHRFRYSLARYVALSLTGASQILFDVLGHDDIETTLGYAFRDPELADEINKIRAEVIAIRVKTIFDHADQNGGMAAGLVKRIKAEMLARSGKAELETDDLGDAIAILGKVELVKPGVICTAQTLEKGACSYIPGERDVGACTSSCMHRLELAANRQTHKGKIDFLLKEIRDVDLGLRVFYQGQLIANFNAFPDLLDDYESDPRLRDALTGCDPRHWATLRDGARSRVDRLMGAVQ